MTHPRRDVSPIILSLCTLVVQVCSSPNQRFTATIHGDIMIGALFSVHQAPPARQAHTRTCGDIREQYGIQRVEAAFHTIDLINRRDDLLPNIKLGIEIRDSCWYSPIALEQSIEFIRDVIATNEEAATSPKYSRVPLRQSSNSTQVATECPVSTKQVKNLIGVIGPGSSTVTIQVQNLLQLFSIPQIGYSATSRDLSEKSFYKYFLRVVPSDFYQAQVMVDIVSQHQWTYISAVHTDGNYGSKGMEAFVKLAEQAGICMAAQESVVSSAEEEDFNKVVQNLIRFPDANVVACFCEGRTIRGLIMATRRLNVSGRFLFIGSDGWSDRNDVVEDYEKEAVGGISVRIHSPYVSTFDDYYFGLHYSNNTRNPWFEEFWQNRFNCSIPNSRTPFQYSRNCTGKEKLSDKYKQDTKMAFVMKAIYTMAHGLHNMQQAMCKGKLGLCPSMLPINGSIFLQYLMNVSFTWNETEMVQFDENGDPPGRYDIMNFQRVSDNSYEYVLVGNWTSGSLTIFKTIQWNTGRKAPESLCSRPCSRGQVKSIQSKSTKCCWVCVPCKENEYLLNEFTCEACDKGWWPNSNLTGCDEIPMEYIRWGDTTSIVSMTIATLGLAATVFVMGVFIRHNNTPVVKASTRELSYIIMVGMSLCHGTTPALLAKPTSVTCFLSRMLPGFSFAIMYSALVTKTLRIARILAGSKKKIITKKPRFMSATAQIVITCILIAFEVVIIATMLVLEPPDSKLAYPTLNRVRLICNTTPLGIIAPLGFDLFLIGMCTVYAVKTRNVPENFNEAKFIGFTMYTTLVIWMAFVPIYFGSSSKVITMCLCISFSSIVALVFLFLPKVYIILFRPEKNSRSAFTTTKDVRCHIGYPISSASRTSSHSTSDFSVESPRDAPVEFTPKPLDASTLKSDVTPRRLSGNVFDRFRTNKHDKKAASVVHRILAIKEAEAMDRRTNLRRSDSTYFPDMARLSAQGSSSTEDGKGEERQLVGILKSAYGKDVVASVVAERKEGAEVGCQTGDELLEALVFRLRRQVVRSETMISMLTPEEEDVNFQATVGGVAYMPSVTGDLDTRWCSAQRGPLSSVFTVQDWLNAETAGGVSPIEPVKVHLGGGDWKWGADPVSCRDKAAQTRDGHETTERTGRSSEVDSCDTEEICGRAGKDDSTVDATSSIMEESASSGSEDTSSSAIYKNIIINLGMQRTDGCDTSKDSTGDPRAESRADSAIRLRHSSKTQSPT